VLLKYDKNKENTTSRFTYFYDNILLDSYRNEKSHTKGEEKIEPHISFFFMFC